MSRRHSRNGCSSSQRFYEDATPQPRRNITLYDAVAGRISSTGFIPTRTHTSRPLDSISNLPLPPEEILFRRRNAPERYEEDDFYWAHENLDPERQQLPDSDLLKAIHAYASDFFGKVLGEEARVSFGSLDETALIALGVLLEEEMGRVLGETGDLVFVEGARRDGGARGLGERRSARMAGRDGKDQSGDSGPQRDALSASSGDDENSLEHGSEDHETSSATESSEEGPVKKRRRVVPESFDTESSA